MRLLVCGSRYWTDRGVLYGWLDEIADVLKIDLVIEGQAPGTDLLAKEWAEARGYRVEAYPADWAKHGRKAGMVRNLQMLHEGRPNLVVAFPMEGSVGTWHMVNSARAVGITTWVWPKDRAAISAIGEGVFV